MDLIDGNPGGEDLILPLSRCPGTYVLITSIVRERVPFFRLYLNYEQKKYSPLGNTNMKGIMISLV